MTAAAIHPVVRQVTERIAERSEVLRRQYLDFIDQQAGEGPNRYAVSCTNQAHDYAAASDFDKLILRQSHRAANIGIVTSYNDVLSAHKPYESYPQQIKSVLSSLGHVGQVAGGVPAMCDGVTQGQDGMELSLFSRDTIALSTAVALSHKVFDGVVMLGICDKIVPGLLMAALRFGHLPAVFLPSGPMHSGITNSEKAEVRQKHAAGHATDDELLESEVRSYHSVGTCTFYGTANSNQMLMEIMGLQLPGSSFLTPDHPLRPYLNRSALSLLSEQTALEPGYMPTGKMLDEKSFVNAMIGLLATGGSTNHTLHIPAMARMAGIIIDWQDFADLSEVTPLLARVYPNGQGDINHFQQAGGMPFLVRELLDAGLLHEDVNTMMGQGLRQYAREPILTTLENGETGLVWHDAPTDSLDLSVLVRADTPFMREGGIRLLQGNIGRGLMKVSAIPEDRWDITAPASVFSTQEDVLEQYRAGNLNRDVIIVLKHQGPKANGMPELHQLMPALANLQAQGFKVALLTDGRLSGASGKVPAVLHICPEANNNGPLNRIQNDDLIHVDARHGLIQVLTDGFEERSEHSQETEAVFTLGSGREMFQVFRKAVLPAEQGALSIYWDDGSDNK